MSVLSIFGDVTLEFVSETVGALHDCHLTGHPQGSTQSGIAVF
jgi:hypothetical protein